LSEELELRQRQAAERKADQAAKTAAATIRRRRRLKIEVAAFVLSAIGVAGVLYYDTTAVSEDFYALHMRFGKLLAVQQGAGHVYRVPILDRVVLIARGKRPLPALRRSAKSAGGSSVSYEAVLGYAVIDAEKYWMRFRSDDAQAALLVTQSIEAATVRAIARSDDKQITATDTQASLAAAISETVNRELIDAGVAVRDLRFVSLRLMP
jgi:hypothetical protein